MSSSHGYQTDQWPNSLRVKNLQQAIRLLEKAKRTAAAIESQGHRLDFDTKKLMEALEWSLEEITRLQKAMEDHVARSIQPVERR